MRTSTRSVIIALAVLFAASDLNFGAAIDLPYAGSFVSSAEAARVVRRGVRVRVGPASVAGVARRTTRRVIRRGAYIASIPARCAYGTHYGYSLYYCGGTYYQKSSSGYVVVYF
jgi:hypothetical protein